MPLNARSMILVICSLLAWPKEAFLLLGQDSKPPTIERIDRAIQAYVDNQEIAGAVTLVADEKRLLHLGTVGKSDLKSNRGMSPDSIFWIASMSKPVTGACVMILVDQGKVSLDEPIATYIPEMNGLKLKDGTKAAIALRHLLTHTSGMSELKSGEAYVSKNLTEAANRYAKVEVLFAPGSKWQYSQTSINTAARIVEVVSGMSFDAFLKEKICEPLGLQDTGFYLTQEQLGRLAKSYKKTDAGLEETEIMILGGKSPTDRERMPAANGGLFSTANDYVRFCQMLLNEGEWKGKRILSKEAVKTMRTIATEGLATGFTPGNGWGIACCVIREPQGVTETLSTGSFGHGGAYGTQAWIDPVKKRIYVLMVQRSNFKNADASEVRKTFQVQAAAIFP